MKSALLGLKTIQLLHKKHGLKSKYVRDQVHKVNRSSNSPSGTAPDFAGGMAPDSKP